jgi:hypothetical protein
MNLKNIFVASFAAAVIAFVWGFFSWTMLPWHNPLKFKDSDAVSSVIKANAPEHGIYLLPVGPESMSDEAGMKKYETDVKAGPFVWTMVAPHVPNYSMQVSMGLSFLRAFVAAVILCLLLRQMTSDCFRCRILFCVLIYLLVGLNSEGPYWIWFNGPLKNMLIMIADHLIEGLLVGVVLAKLVKPIKIS